MTNELAIILIFIALSGGGAMGYGLKVLRSEWDAMKEAVKTSKQRNPYRTNDGLEDAMSINLDLALEAAETLKYIESRARQQLEILRVIRSDPDHYDSDKPNGKKSK